MFMETSASTTDNVNDAFVNAPKNVFDQIRQGSLDLNYNKDKINSKRFRNRKWYNQSYLIQLIHYGQ